MKIVTLEWFEQSLERGMVLEEAFYNPTLPVEQRGRGAWDRKDYPPPSIGKRARASDQNEVVNLLRRKLRRSASTKLGSQSEALWAGITAANTEIPHNEDDDWTDSNIDRQHLSRDQTPTADAQDAASLSDDAPLADPAADLHQPQDLPPAVVSQDGIFAGSVISTHGFEQEKVKSLHGLSLEHANTITDVHLTDALGEQRGTLCTAN